ncbi:hypothetical protein [Deinococcus sp. Leaf326]|jgi:4-amino-4-deoxy-L-arabinose transferase-like glycosyltransferase|uniref:hypothetical protein n=1 Tax=Deinococcus sp. Leaf326 TaxID=1736338 RepID=UPI0006F9D7D4|nr:hypothetical protein [Deinococcus sp. Leaf326]KQR41096.1 hypothetical protein ASF71_02950 [Deinococcus sp. Leaf326]
MLLTAVYLLVTLLTALILVIFLLRAGAARAMVVWGIAATLPLLAALTASLSGQARATRALQDYVPQSTQVVVQTAARDYDLVLNPEDAACLERTVRLRSEADLVSGNQTVPVRADTLVTGTLPPSAVVEALTVRGQLGCHNFHSVPGVKK